MVIFTSICANYLHKARTLGYSIKKHMPSAIFVVCLLENKMEETYSSPYFDDVILAKDSWEGNFERFIFKHTIVEASTSVKGQFFRFLYKQYPNEDQFVYLDPDTFVYSDFVELKKELVSVPALLCPHLLVPGNIDMELSSAAHGVYNLGFLAVNRSEEAMKLIDWWAERLYLYCYDDKENGVFTDQKWMNLAPCFFDVKLFKHHGYDFATWSLLNSKIDVENNEYYVNGDPLRFIHFSGYGDTIENCMRNWLPEEDHLFRKLYKEYSAVHENNNLDSISKTPWSYACYNSGEKIDDEIRKAYRTNYDLMFSIENPFEQSNDFFNSRTVNKKTYSIMKKSKNYYKQYGFVKLVKKIIEKISTK